MKLVLEKEKQDNHADLDNEDTLIRRAQLGDEAAFDAIIRMYQKKVFKLAYGFFREPEDAMEIVQETFLRVFRTIRGFREDQGSRQFQSWLYRVTANLCIDYYRKFRKKRLRDTEMEDVHHKLHGASDDPETRMSREALNSGIRDAVDRLPKREKMVFTLKHYSNLKYQDIAGVMNIAVGTVKSTHHRALSHVKSHVLALEK